jgi:hypothetical protein
MARLDVFIDASNFSVACRQLIHGYVDVKALARLLATKSCHELGEVFWYDSRSHGPMVLRRQQTFFGRD